MDLEDPDDYVNEARHELLSYCTSDKDCYDGRNAVDKSGKSSLACQSNKCRLKPGEFCYPGNDHLPYVCYNKNRCEKRYVLRKFKKD